MKRFLLCITLLVAGLLPHGSVLAAVDLFLKLDGITGESTNKTHPGWIDISSYQFGVANTGSSSAGGGKASFSDLSVTKLTDVSSPSLLFDTASGKHIKDGLLDVVQAGGANKPFLEYKFTDLLISGYSVSSGGDRPQESLSLNFTKLQFTERSQKPDGSFGPPIATQWDLSLNKGISPTGAVPEPATLALLATGLGILGLQVGRRRRS